MKYFKSFLKEWGSFILIITLIALSRLFLWRNVSVEGHSMDPTLADGVIMRIKLHSFKNDFKYFIIYLSSSFFAFSVFLKCSLAQK